MLFSLVDDPDGGAAEKVIQDEPVPGCRAVEGVAKGMSSEMIGTQVDAAGRRDAAGWRGAAGRGVVGLVKARFVDL